MPRSGAPVSAWAPALRLSPRVHVPKAKARGVRLREPVAQDQLEPGRPRQGLAAGARLRVQEGTGLIRFASVPDFSKIKHS